MNTTLPRRVLILPSGSLMAMETPWRLGAQFVEGQALAWPATVVFTEHVEQAVGLRPLPAVVGKVTGGVQRGTVATSVENSVALQTALARSRKRAPLSASP